MKNLIFLLIALLFFSITQAQGNIDTVIIGKQTWMQRNLDVSRYANGDTIPEVKDSTAWADLTTGAWCNYNNDPAKGKMYGRLYNWYAVNDSRGLSPKGWHIPGDAEWTTLTDYLGGESLAGGKMKETGLTNWESPNGNASNFYSFTGLPGGFRDSTGAFNTIGKNGSFWCSSQTTTTNAWLRTLVYFSGFIIRYDVDKKSGFSVRCIRD